MSRQKTDKQTDILITILRTPLGAEVTICLHCRLSFADVSVVLCQSPAHVARFLIYYVLFSAAVRSESGYIDTSWCSSCSGSSVLLGVTVMLPGDACRIAAAHVLFRATRLFRALSATDNSRVVAGLLLTTPCDDAVDMAGCCQQSTDDDRLLITLSVQQLYVRRDGRLGRIQVVSVS